jgi:transcriptional regulator with GAF, ATPase, and Fis domain
MTQPTRQILRQLATRFGIVGESAPMVQAITRLLQVAPTDLTVLITGETGTGKEVFAHAMHELSPRKKHPFVSVNCGAIPETLLESELFGAEKGAYTGSVEQRRGFFEAAHRGTILLDEIGEMPVSTQVKLLRVLESGEFSRLGSSDVHKVDVRVIAATNRDLMYEVRQGRFRQDLFFRLNSVGIHLPPLRQHTDDIPLLVEHFAQRACDAIPVMYQGIDAEAIDVLTRYHWPGNVRELRNVVETMVTLERGERITASMAQNYLPAYDAETAEPVSTGLMHLRTVPIDAGSTADIQMLYRTLLQVNADVAEMKTVLRHLLAMSMEFRADNANDASLAVTKPSSNDALPTLNMVELERMAIDAAMRKANGNRREAANILGISTRTLYRKLDEFGIE